MDEKLKELEKEFILKYAQESRAGNLDPCCSTGSVWNWITSNFNPLDALLGKAVPKADVLLAEIKEAVAVNYGYRVEMPTKWDYAMSVACRTKKQLEMYEAVISKLLSK